MIKVEYSKDLEKAKIGNVSIGIDGKKRVRLYEHNMNDNYKVNDTTEDEETLKIMQQDKCLVELIFYHNESIESLIRVLESLKDKDFIKEQDNPEMYKKINNALSEEKSNLVLHAENELNIILARCEDEESRQMQIMMNNDILEIIKVFSEQGHSGFSAGYAISLLQKLLKYEPITPLTGNDDEWNRLDYGDDVQYQNKRCSRIFKNADGQAYDSEGKIFSDDGGKSWYQSKNSRTYITFPYIPKTEKVIVEKKEENKDVK